MNVIDEQQNIQNLPTTCPCQISPTDINYWYTNVVVLFNGDQLRVTTRNTIKINRTDGVKQVGQCSIYS